MGVTSDAPGLMVNQAGRSTVRDEVYYGSVDLRYLKITKFDTIVNDFYRFSLYSRRFKLARIWPAGQTAPHFDSKRYQDMKENQKKSRI